MIAPTGEFYAIIAHLFDTWEKLCKWDISPLPGE
jgi:hypothetical protein